MDLWHFKEIFFFFFLGWVQSGVTQNCRLLTFQRTAIRWRFLPEGRKVQHEGGMWGGWQSTSQLEGACAHLAQLGSEPLDVPALEEAAGVGVQVPLCPPPISTSSSPSPRSLSLSVCLCTSLSSPRLSLFFAARFLSPSASTSLLGDSLCTAFLRVLPPPPFVTHSLSQPRLCPLSGR